MVTIPEGYAQANFIFSGAALPNGAQITLGVDLGSLVGTPSSLAQLIYDDFSVVIANLAGSVALTELLLKIGPSETGPTGTASGSLVGGGADTVAPNTAFLVSKHTGIGGRRGRGRWFLPGVSAGDVNNAGEVNGAQITAMDADLVTFHAALISDGFIPVLLHTGPMVPSAITSFETQAFVATQRRRLRR